MCDTCMQLSCLPVPLHVPQDVSGCPISANVEEAGWNERAAKYIKGLEKEMKPGMKIADKIIHKITETVTGNASDLK